MCVYKTLPSFKPLSPQRRSACLTDVRQEVRKRCRGRGRRSAGRRAEVPRASVVSPQSRLLSLLLLVLVPGMINGPDEYCYSSVLPAGQRRAHTPWTHALFKTSKTIPRAETWACSSSAMADCRKPSLRGQWAARFLRGTEHRAGARCPVGTLAPCCGIPSELSGPLRLSLAPSLRL